MTKITPKVCNYPGKAPDTRGLSRVEFIAASQLSCHNFPQRLSQPGGVLLQSPWVGVMAGRKELWNRGKGNFHKNGKLKEE